MGDFGFYFFFFFSILGIIFLNGSNWIQDRGKEKEAGVRECERLKKKKVLGRDDKDSRGRG